MKLSPFLGPDDLTRVKSHLQFSELSFEEKHPIILPKGMLHWCWFGSTTAPSLGVSGLLTLQYCWSEAFSQTGQKRMCSLSEVKWPAGGPLATGQSHQGATLQCIRFRAHRTFVLCWPLRKENLCVAVHMHCSKSYSFGVSGLTQYCWHCVGFEEVCCAPWVACNYLLWQCKGLWCC